MVGKSDPALAGSSSAPVLSASPYAAVIGNPKKSSMSGSRKGAWNPPPGAFNHPDLPEFTAPGPGRYTPSVNSVRPRVVGTRFGSEDRFKYLGPQQPLEQTSAGMCGTVRISYSPGPLYKPSHDSAKPRAPTVAFGGRGPGTIKKPPSMIQETPGPGSYEHAVTLADGAKTSTKPRSSAAGFGSTKRSEMGPPDSAHCFHGKVPVDMTNHQGGTNSPGPVYAPSIEPVRAASNSAVFGTSKRVTRSMRIA